MTLTPEKRKSLLIVITAGIALLGAAYYFGFRWINEAKQNTDLKVKALKEKVAKFEKDMKLGAAAEKKIDILEERLKPFEEQMPPAAAETWLTKAIYTTANRQKLKLKFSRLMEPEPYVRDDLRSVVHFGVAGYGFSVYGSYFELGDFVANLERTYPMMAVETITISSGAGGAANIHDMQVRISMVTQAE